MQRFNRGALVFALLCAGCSSSDFPKTVPVSGTLMVDGKPFEGAKVVFMNADSPRAASAVTDAKGEFKLTTFKPFDGAVIGTHGVSITVPTAADSVDPSELDPTDPGDAYNQMMIESSKPDSEKQDSGPIPIKYASPRTSGLTFTVTEEGPNEFPIMIE